MPRVSRIGIIHIAFAVFALCLIGRAARVQILERQAWIARAESQHFARAGTVPPRGTIYDAAGERLAESREVVRLQVAPNEVRPEQRNQLVRGLMKLGLSRSVALRAVDRKRKWVELPGRYFPLTAQPVTRLRGVHVTRAAERVSDPLPGLRRVVGRVNVAGVALDGLELALDTLLRGRSGRRPPRATGAGAASSRRTRRGAAPVPGTTWC